MACSLTLIIYECQTFRTMDVSYHRWNFTRFNAKRSIERGAYSCSSIYTSWFIFYRAMLRRARLCHHSMSSVRSSVCPWRYRDHIGWNTTEISSRSNSLRYLLTLAIWSNGSDSEVLENGNAQTFPSKFPTLKPTLLNSYTQSLVGFFSVRAKCVTLNDL